MKKSMFAISVFTAFFLCVLVAVAENKNPAVNETVKKVSKDDGGKIYVLKEIRVDTVKALDAEEINNMKANAVAEVTQIEGYVAQYNKPGATEKDKKEALKGIQNILGKRVDDYFQQVQSRIDIIDNVAKQAKEELKAEKKGKNAFVTEEAQAIVDGKMPFFRIPEMSKSK